MWNQASDKNDLKSRVRFSRFLTGTKQMEKKKKKKRVLRTLIETRVT
jgi:hypothetical protein